MPEYRITGEVTETRQVQTEAQSRTEARKIFHEVFEGAEVQILDVTLVNDDN